MENSNWFNDFEFQQQLDRISRSRSLNGNSASLLINGGVAFKQRKENIKNADVIFLKTFEFHDDETGKNLVALLTKKARQGAKIFIQIDVYGFFETYRELNEILKGKRSPVPPFIQKIADSAPNNVFIIPTNVPTRKINIIYGYRFPKDHEKYLLTWKHTPEIEPVRVIMGGLNIGDQYAFPGSFDEHGKPRTIPAYIGKGAIGGEKKSYGLRDTDLETIGPVNYEIAKEFIRAAKFHVNNQNSYFKEHLLEGVKAGIAELDQIYEQMQKDSIATFPVCGDAYIRFIATPPHQKGNDFPIAMLFDAIIRRLPHNAVVRVSTAFFLPTKKIQKVLLSALEKGISFDFIINDLEVSEGDIQTVVYATLSRVRHLLMRCRGQKLQFHAYLGDRNLGIGGLHQKAFSIGQNEDDPFFITSSNFDASSLNWNSEGGLLIQSPQLKRQFDAMLKEDLIYTEPVTLEMLDQRKFGAKIYGFILDKLLSPIL